MFVPRLEIAVGRTNMEALKKSIMDGLRFVLLILVCDIPSS